jgi:amino acid adenylation domain-containing protein
MTQSQSLSPERLELLRRMLRDKGLAPGGGARPIPVRAADASPVGLSTAQERVWVHEELSPGSAAYVMPSAIRLRGRVEAEVVRRCWALLVERHAALRTRVGLVDGEPVQDVAPVFEPALGVTDLTPLPESERAERLAELNAQACEPFDVRTGPLLRLHLVHESAHEHLLLMTVHHLVADGWSISLLVDEFARCYEALAAGREPDFAPIPIAYTDFTAWQNSQSTSGEAREQLGWWRERLAGAPALLNLPWDRPRPAALSHRGGRESVAIPGGTARALLELGRSTGATAFMTLLAAHTALMARYSGEQDLVIGTPVAGRTRPELENLVGYLSNTVALRLDLRADPSFAELLETVRETCLEAFARQDVPFQRVVQELAADRDLSHTPLFQVMFLVGERNAVTRMPGSGLELEREEPDTGTAKFDLSVHAEDRGDELVFTFQYAADLFDAETVRRMAGDLRTLIAAAVADPHRPVTRLPLASDGVPHAIAAGHAARPVHERISEQARRTPDAVAVTHDGHDTTTYAELESRANRLAHRLQAEGIGPESVVGILADRSADLVTAILAALKAGAAYLPLDPDYPAERLSHMLTDSRTAAVLTTTRHVHRLPAHVVVELSPEDPDTAAHPDTPPETAVHPDNLAYLIYTSGSTGTPKAVGVAHRQLDAYLAWAEGLLDDPAAEIPAIGSICFDASLKQLLGPLLRGAAVRIIDAETVRDPVELLRTLRPLSRFSINCVPSLWSELLAAIEAGEAAPPGLTGLLLGGERLPGDLVRRTRAALPAVRITNLYGPTEATANASAGRVEPDSVVTMGTARPGTALYVLDGALQPVPPGVAGELWIGGDGLARGYLGKPGLTAARFLPDPYAATADARMYRTGDRVRQRADGTVEFLGRTDDQLKLRGFRIEPAEIESVLAAHPAVREAAVALAEVGGRQRLIGYVVPDQQTMPHRAELLRWLTERLPAYQVPSDLVTLAELPRTPAGKTDRRALPVPASPHAGPSGRRDAPATLTEEVLHGIWAEALGVAAIGRTEDFFELGGHSLVATRLATRVRQTFRTIVPLRVIFEQRTIAGLARWLDQRTGMRPASGETPIPALPRDGSVPLPLSFAQQRLWFLGRLVPDTPMYNLPIAVRLRGPLDVQALQKAFDAVVARHEVLRSLVETRDGTPVLRVAAERPLPIAVEDLSTLPEPEREEAARCRADAEVLRPFALDADPPMRLLLLRLGAEENVLVLSMHHIAWDAFSVENLFTELSAGYAAAIDHKPIDLPPLPLQYADYAAWQRAALTGDELERHVAYWRGRLGIKPERLSLPRTGEWTPADTRAEQVATTVLPSVVRDALKSLCAQEGVTLYMALLAGFSLVLRDLSGSDDISIGTPYANRARGELQPLIGMFVNTLVLRVGLGEDTGFRKLLAHVREITLGAYAHQDLPFEKLVEELQPAREASGSPYFQAWMAFHAEAPAGRDVGRRLPLAGLRTELFDLGPGAARHELRLDAWEQPNGLFCSFGCPAGLFDGGLLDRLASGLELVLRTVAEQPETTPRQLADALAGLNRRQWMERGERLQEAGLRGLRPGGRRATANTDVHSETIAQER